MKKINLFYCKAIIIYLLFNSHTLLAAVYTLQAGGEPVVFSAINISTQGDRVCLGPVIGSGNDNLANVVGFSYSDKSYPQSNLSCYGMTKWVCVDGKYCGVPINNSIDTIILVPNGTVKSIFAPVYNATPHVTGSVNFTGLTPLLTTAISDGFRACFSQSQHPNSYYIGSDQNTASFTSTLTWRLYVGKKTPEGSYNIANLFIANPLSASCSSNIYSQGDTVNVIEPLACTVTPPATVDFGEVNITGVSTANQLLATKKGDLTVNCTGGKTKVTMNVSFSGGYAATTRQLSLKDSNNVASRGFVLGRYTADTAGTCTPYTSGDVYFDNSNPKVINNVVVGNTNIPITWSLCSHTSGAFGKSSAQATVNINWD